MCSQNYVFKYSTLNLHDIRLFIDRLFPKNHVKAENKRYLQIGQERHINSQQDIVHEIHDPTQFNLMIYKNEVSFKRTIVKYITESIFC